MVSFQKKDITEGSIGDRLRLAREKRGDSLEAVERATRIPKKYLTAIEANAFAKLPDLVYAKNFVRALASLYGLDQTSLTEGLMKEMTVAGGRTVFGADRPVSFVGGRRLVVTPGRARKLLVILLLTGLVGYFGLSVRTILKPPYIIIESPTDNQVIEDGQVTLRGRTEPETELTVNNESVPVEADGSFNEILRLPPGVSNLRIAGKKKHSGERELFLRVIVEGQVGSATNTISATGTPK